MTDRRPVCAFFVLLGLLGVGHVRVAVADEEDEVLQPVLVFTLAGVDRALADMDYVLGLGERAELAEQARGLIAFANDLEGLDREKPLGVALYLKPGLVPTPVPVGFVPVGAIEDLLETVELGPVVTRKVTGTSNQYEVVGRRRSLFVQVRDGYALVANDTLTFEDDLRHPAPLAEELAKKFDVALAVYVANVPETTREFFLQLLKTSANAELQQRDDEPDARYALRRANGKRTFESIEMFLRDVRRLTIGLDASIERHAAVVDLDVDLTPDSELAQLLDEAVGKRSLFAPLVDESLPLTMTGSWTAGELDRNTLLELLNVGRVQLARSLNPGVEPTVDPETGQPTPIEDPLATRLMEPLVATAKSGHVDFFLRFQPDGGDRMVLVGGVRLLNAEDFGASLASVVQRQSENPNVSLDLRPNVDAHRDMAVHRVQRDESNEREARLYGEPPALYFAAGHRAVWFAIGGDGATSALKDAVDGVLDATIEQRVRDQPPFRLVVNAKPWLTLPPPNSPRFNEFAPKAFSPGGDAIRADFRPTENGARMRMTIEEGFLRLMGYGIGAAADFREQQRERLRELREPAEDAESPAM